LALNLFVYNIRLVQVTFISFLTEYFIELVNTDFFALRVVAAWVEENDFFILNAFHNHKMFLIAT
jgi:hypothetical protein